MPSRAVTLRILAIIATGLMIAALVPPYSFATLAWVGLVPFLIALWSLKGKHRAKKGFLIGYLTGAIAFGIQVSWLSTISWLGPVVLAGYLPIYFGAFGAFAATIGNPWHRKKGVSETPLRSLFNAFTHASIWAGLELLRGWIFTGFSWNGLGIAFHDTLVISQAADILGVAGLSLMLVFFQCVLVQVGHRLMKTGTDGILRPRWDFAVTALIVGMLLAYGILRIAGESGKDSIPLKALLVQINIPHDGATVLWEMEKVHMAYEDETLEALKNLADTDEKKLQAAIEKNQEGSIELSNPDWVVWPEAALFGRIVRTDDGERGAWKENIDSIARVREGGEDFDLIYGAVEMEGEVREDGLYPKKDGRIYNSIVIETPEGDQQTFQKHHLVIFGETIPLIETFPFLQKIYEQQSGQKYYGSFQSGSSHDPLPVDINGETVGIIPAVCFEDTVPRLTRKFVRDGPQIIVNLTNDGWFKESPAAAQHFANARFRAIELRRPMIRCANTGVSAAIDTIGSTTSPETGKQQIIQDEKGSTFLQDHLLVRLNIPKQPSFSLYALIGDWGIILLSAIGFATAIVFRKH
ncbi:MAG: apolipoprotein N-acyltransferase [Verrucomicrobia bacterium]|jgi:apolipoprotein N-acyltransferase|nr:apolipoprotein N-acyltransferase [Verrucomicrobiota bacterium]|tara:strand:- start:9697 stop:11436 length:1740 start_codon:yes stop_codon:yes gene_type:complete